MVNRVQTLRSSTSAAVPAAGSRQPGELWVNFPDAQLGVIDTSRNAQKLLATRYFSALGTYVTGDMVAQAGQLYIANGAISPGAFNAGQWTKITTATDITGAFLPLGGGTLTGPLTLNADPSIALGAATKQYVDAHGVTPSGSAPLMNGTAAAGSSVNYSRGDHVHPTDTSRAPLASPTFTGTPVAPTPTAGDSSTKLATTAFVGGALGNYLPLAGGTLTGNLIAPNISTSGAMFAATGFSCNSTIVGYIETRTTALNSSGDAIVSFYDQVPTRRGYIGYLHGSTNVSFINDTSGARLDLVGGVNYLSTNASAQKPGGGPWLDSSDARIKNVLEDYTPGLDEILELQPKIFTYKGNDTQEENGESVHKTVAEQNKEFVGLIAQDVEPVLPGMVLKSGGYIDGVRVDDLRTLDSSELIYALVNAVKTLTARIEQLESGT